MKIKKMTMANEETRTTTIYCKLSDVFAKSGVIKKIVAVPVGTATIFR
jgi:hypothetical protein